MSNDFYAPEFEYIFNENCKPLTEKQWRKGLKDYLQEIRQNNPSFGYSETDKNVAVNELLESRVQSGELLVYKSNYYYVQEIESFLEDIFYLVEGEWNDVMKNKEIKKLVSYCKKRLGDILS